MHGKVARNNKKASYLFSLENSIIVCSCTWELLLLHKRCGNHGKNKDELAGFFTLFHTFPQTKKRELKETQKTTIIANSLLHGLSMIISLTKQPLMLTGKLFLIIIY